MGEVEPFFVQILGCFLGDDFRRKVKPNLLQKYGGGKVVLEGINFGWILRVGKKVSAESFKKESAVCRNEKRSLLKKKAQLFLHNF